MTGYTRFWDCAKCGTRVETIDWPRKGDDLCERCYGEREVERAKMDAVLLGVGFVLDGKRIDPARIRIFSALSPGVVTEGL